jgi:hypothetical protein
MLLYEPDLRHLSGLALKCSKEDQVCLGASGGFIHAFISSRNVSSVPTIIQALL